MLIILGSVFLAFGTGLVCIGLASNHNSARLQRTSLGSFFLLIGLVQFAYRLNQISRLISVVLIAGCFVCLVAVWLRTYKSLAGDLKATKEWEDATIRLKGRIKDGHK